MLSWCPRDRISPREPFDTFSDVRCGAITIAMLFAGVFDKAFSIIPVAQFSCLLSIRPNFVRSAQTTNTVGGPTGFFRAAMNCRGFKLSKFSNRRILTLQQLINP